MYSQKILGGKMRGFKVWRGLKSVHPPSWKSMVLLMRTWNFWDLYLQTKKPYYFITQDIFLSGGGGGFKTISRWGSLKVLYLKKKLPICPAVFCTSLMDTHSSELLREKDCYFLLYFVDVVLILFVNNRPWNWNYTENGFICG